MKRVLVFLFFLCSFSLYAQGSDPDFDARITQAENSLKNVEALLPALKELINKSEGLTHYVDDEIKVIDGCIDRLDSRIEQKATIDDDQLKDFSLMASTFRALKRMLDDDLCMLKDITDHQAEINREIENAKTILNSEMGKPLSVERFSKLNPLLGKLDNILKQVVPYYVENPGVKLLYSNAQRSYWFAQFGFYKSLFSSEPVSTEKYEKAKRTFNADRLLYQCSL
ncbi:MAG: hypothetical protein V1647_06400 [Pseudomonadota bacterium]